MKVTFRTHFYQSPVYLFFVIAISITITEYAIMFSFRFLPHFSNVAKETIDSALIFAISSPILYSLVYRPLRFQITEREKAKRNWEVTFDSIKDPLYLHDSECRIIQANKAYRNIAGMPFKDMIGRPYYEVFPKTGSPFKSCSKALELEEEEITLSDIDKIFRIRFYPVYDDNKYYFNSVHIFEDITEKKRIENELKLLNESLEQRVMERSAAIVKAKEELRVINESLEKRVSERTRELTKANEELQREITDRKQAEEEIKKLNSLLLSIRNINEVLLKVKDESELFNKISSFLLNTGFIKFAWIGLIGKDVSGIKPVAHAGLDYGYLALIKVKLNDPVYSCGPAGVAIKTGEPIFIKDVESDNRYKLSKSELIKRGFVSIASIPLKPEEKTIGILNIYSDRKDAFGEKEIKYLVQVAGDIGIGYKSLMLEKKLKQSIEDLRTSLNSAIEAISLTGEFRDPYTAGHEKRVAQLACAIATEIGFEADRLTGVRVSAFLHDIGKIAVPAEILSKPTALSTHEYGIIKTHPKVGFDILKNLNFPWPVAQITLQHHETLNGSGYPAGLKGEEILMESRILAVADVVEAMTNHRPYRPAYGIDKALEEIIRNKGILYDPSVTDVCLKLIKEKGFRFVEETGQLARNYPTPRPFPTRGEGTSHPL